MQDDPLEFFARYCRVPIQKSSARGVCRFCQRIGLLFEARTISACKTCLPIRMGYQAANRVTTLSVGDFAMITRKSAVYYTVHNISSLRSRPARPFIKYLCELVHNKIEDDFMLLRFGKPTPVLNLVVNRCSSDLIRISGDTVIDKTAAPAVDVHRVRRLLAEFPSAQWSEISAVISDVRSNRRGEQAMKQWQKLNLMFPGIFEKSPNSSSIEMKMLRNMSA